MNNENVTNEHLDEETLHSFSRDPENQKFQNARLHLIECSHCLNKVQLLQSMESLLQENANLITTSSDNSSLKSKLHAVSHEIAMSKSMEENQTVFQSNDAPTRNTKGVWQAIRKAFTIDTPAFAIPGTAIASFIFAFVLFSSSPTQQPGVTSFQDSQVLALTKTGTRPGIGFFHEADKNEQLISDYTGFSIESKGPYLEVRWAKVKDSEQYQLELFEISHNVSQSIKKYTTSDTMWKIDRKALRPGQLYRLSMSGNTKQNFHFRHMGGFILH